jgi:DNA-binding LacI/PurR family transcriptional regulator/DNA-binding transcriptional regulator YhcF (GntR family)
MHGTLEAARSVVASEIARTVQLGRSRLRGVRVLAAESGISHVTLLRALREEVTRGNLRSRPGSGMWLPSAPQGPVVNATGGPKWERIAATLRRDVLLGRYSVAEPFPAFKELTHTLGVSRPTLRRALAQLECEGLVAVGRSEIRVACSSPQPRRNAIIVCAASDDFGNVQLATARTIPLLQDLKSECNRAGVEMRLLPFERRFRYRPNVDNAPAMLSAQGDSRDVLGGILLCANLPDRTVSETLAWFAERDRPVGVLDEGGELDPSFHRRAGVHYLSMADSPLCGRIVARQLLAMGHRGVAFVSPYRGVRWSENRAWGLRQSFEGARPEAHLYEYTGERVAGDPDPRSRTALLDRLEAVLSSRTHGLSLTRETRADVRRSMANVLILHLNRQRTRIALLPLLRQALRGPAVTALVACNDTVGIAALAFLRRQGIAVPVELSVVGFDDSLESYEAKLTSYNFNTQAAARSLLNHVLRRRLSRQTTGAMSTEIEGFVNVRASARWVVARATALGPAP